MAKRDQPTVPDLGVSGSEDPAEAQNAPSAVPFSPQADISSPLRGVLSRT